MKNGTVRRLRFNAFATGSAFFVTNLLEVSIGEWVWWIQRGSGTPVNQKRTKMAKPATCLFPILNTAAASFPLPARVNPVHCYDEKKKKKLSFLPTGFLWGGAVTALPCGRFFHGKPKSSTKARDRKELGEALARVTPTHLSLEGGLESPHRRSCSFFSQKTVYLAPVELLD